jgi:hypothetical protein
MSLDGFLDTEHLKRKTTGYPSKLGGFPSHGGVTQQLDGLFHGKSDMI